MQDSVEGAEEALNTYQHYPIEYEKDGVTPLKGSHGIDFIEADYGKLLPIMVKAIQDLSAQVESLKEEIVTIKAKKEWYQI